MMKFEVKDHFTGKIKFVAEIECEASAADSVKLGLAVKWAVKNRADLTFANLHAANLTDADLTRAKGVEMAIAMTRILPEGDLIGWKKCRDGVLVKLQIPADAKRSHAFGRKCRAEYVECLEVIGADAGVSEHDGKTEYRVGATVRSDKWNENWQKECAGGIHFFITREEAEIWLV